MQICFHSCILFQENTPYYVKLKAINNAGGETMTQSRPIVLDLIDPYAGDVKDGALFRIDAAFQNVSDSITGNSSSFYSLHSTYIYS